MPRLLSLFAIPDLGWLEEPLFYAVGFPVRIRLALFSLAGIFAALQLTQLPLEVRGAAAAAGVLLGALPVKPPLSKLFARREPREEQVYWAPMGSILVYVQVPEPGELVILVDGEDYDKIHVEAGLARIEVAGLSPGEHTVKLLLSQQVLQELRVYSGEKRVSVETKAETGAAKAGEQAKGP